MANDLGSDYLRVGQFAVQRGALTRDQLEECVRLLSEEAYEHMKANSPIPTLGDILVRKGYISSVTLHDIEEEIEKTAEEQPLDRRFGKYRLIREIGRGGMSVVWEAFDTELRRRVAIKFLSGYRKFSKFQIEVEDDEVVKRFYREAQTAARLNHPNVIRIFEVGIHESAHFIAMEYLEGDSFQDRLDRGRLSFQETAKIIRDAALGVQHAHDYRVLHRDIKPQNIMITERDDLMRVVVMDFGLAHDLKEHQRLTLSGIAIGTPAYMSPEQAQGSKNVLDPRSDVYSLGAVLYESVSGQAPFEGESPMEVMLAVVNDEAKPLRKVKPDCPADLEMICHKAMSKDPEVRYTSAGAFAADLMRFIDGDIVEAQPPSFGYRARKMIRKYPVALVATVLTLTLTLLGGLYVMAVNREIRTVTIKNYWDNTQMMILAKNYNAARIDCRALLHLDPENKRAQKTLQFLKQRLEEQEALEIQRKKRRLREDALEALLTGQLEMERNDYTMALESMSTAIGIDPGYARAFLWRGRLYLALRQPEEALHDFRAARNLEPEPESEKLQRDISRELGLEYWRRKNYEKAEEELRRCVDLDPSFLSGQRSYGVFLLQIREFSRAEEVLTLVIEKAHDDAGMRKVQDVLYFNRAQARYVLWKSEREVLGDRWEGAMRDVDIALRRNSNHASAWRLRGMLYHEKEYYEKAVSDYREAMRLGWKAKGQLEEFIQKARERKKLPPQ